MSVWPQSIPVWPDGVCGWIPPGRTSLGPPPCLMWLWGDGCRTPKPNCASVSSCRFRTCPGVLPREQGPARPTEASGTGGKPSTKWTQNHLFLFNKEKGKSRSLGLCSWAPGPLCNFHEVSLCSLVTSLLQPVPETVVFLAAGSWHSLWFLGGQAAPGWDF